VVKVAHDAQPHPDKTTDRFLNNSSSGKNGKNIILCWIPSHVGILGNEKSDAAAKSALSYLSLV